MKPRITSRDFLLGYMLVIHTLSDRRGDTHTAVSAFVELLRSVLYQDTGLILEPFPDFVRVEAP